MASVRVSRLLASSIRIPSLTLPTSIGFGNGHGTSMPRGLSLRHVFPDGFSIPTCRPDSIEHYLALQEMCRTPRQATEEFLMPIERFVDDHEGSGTARNRDTLRRMREAISGFREVRPLPDKKKAALVSRPYPGRLLENRHHSSARPDRGIWYRLLVCTPRSLYRSSRSAVCANARRRNG